MYIFYNVFSNNYSDNDKYVVWVILFLIFGRPTSESKHILKVIYNFYLNNFDKNASDNEIDFFYHSNERNLFIYLIIPWLVLVFQC